MIIKQLADIIQGKAPPHCKRSSKWPSVRKAHLKKFPTCAVCGGTKKLEVHHIVSFFEDPSKELDPTNLITLCEARKTLNCHIVFGHYMNYKNINPNVIEDARIWNEKLKKYSDSHK
jgi:hypothetical protein